MKKLISLSVIVFTAAAMFGQDTTSISTKKSQTGSGLDSIPPGKQADTSALGRGKWADSSKNKTWQDSSMNNNSDTSGTGGSANSNTDSSTSKSDSSSSTTKVQDKVVMMNDKVYVVKSGDSTMLTDSVRLGSGAVVKSDASVTFKDGSTTKLKNGQYIALTAPPTTTTTTTTTTSSSSENNSQPATANAQADSSATATKPVAEDRVVMTNDKVVVVKNGDSTLLDGSIKLQSGAVVMADGKVTFKNGTTTQLKNGQFIALNPAAEADKATTTKKTTKSIKTTKTSATKKTPRSPKTTSE